MMIPKIIHYIWLGGNDKSKDILRCIDTWKKHLKDYQFIEWNEENFDVHSHPYCRDAYKNEKWAYVSDYIRAYAIYNYGGIYMDTDVLVLENFDSLLNNRAFVGFENPDYPFTAVFGAEKKHPFIKDILDMYDNFNFSYDKKNEYKEVNTKTVSDILVKKYDCLTNNKFQILKEDLAVYPDYILCNPSKKSISIHIFTGTWIEKAKPLKRKITKIIKLRLTTKFRASLYARFISKNRT